MRIYYAHPMSWYGTEGEKLDVAALDQHGTVVNPNSQTFQDMVEDAKRRNFPVMQIFADYIRDWADVVAFRRFDGDFKLGAGVAREIFEARVWGKGVWEVYGQTDRHINKEIGMKVNDWPDYVSFGDILTVSETKLRIAARRR